MTTNQPVEGASVTRAGVVVRTVDQGLWSLGFFIFNVTAGVTLPLSDFAALSVAAALGFIAVGTSRAWGIYGPIVDAASRGVRPEDSIDRRSSWRGTLAFASVVGALSFGWTSRSVSIEFAVAVGCLAALMVVSDLPRQVLIIRGRYSYAAYLASLYAIGGAVTVAAVSIGAGTAVLLSLWFATLSVVLVVGVVFCGNATNPITSTSYLGVAWRITAEAVYLGVGSQIAVLLLFLVQDDTATAGIRFAYSLVFAPAFVIVQSVQPLVFKHLATLSAGGTRAVIAVSLRWNAAIAVGLASCGVLGFVALATAFDGSGPSVALPYVVPVGVAILSAQTFEAALMATRFFVTPVLIHRARLASVLIDVSGQGVGVVLAGASGLVWALILLSTARIAAAAAMLAVLPRRERTVSS